MVALVTGGHGFIGSHVRRAFEAAGATSVAAGRPDHEIPSAEFAAQLREVRPDVVVHCAGPASVADSVARPHADLAGSVGVLAAVLAAIVEERLGPRFVLVSSAAVYGDPGRLPIAEDVPPAPISPYGYHRWMCELALHEFHAVYDVPTAALRVFSGYGEGLRRQILWDICQKAAATGRIELAGTGAESRDFVHADDIARAALTVAESAPMEAEAYNVGTGVETPIADLAGRLAPLLGVDPEAVSFSEQRRAADPSNWRADISRLRGLGFEPTVALDEGLPRYVQWAAGHVQGSHVLPNAH